MDLWIMHGNYRDGFGSGILRMEWSLHNIILHSGVEAHTIRLRNGKY